MNEDYKKSASGIGVLVRRSGADKEAFVSEPQEIDPDRVASILSKTHYEVKEVRSHIFLERHEVDQKTN